MSHSLNGGALNVRTLGVALAAAAGLLSGCGDNLPPSSFDGRRPLMRPEQFFDGATRSTGLLETSDGAPSQRFTVEGRGRVLPDGRFQLDQTVVFEGKPATSRRWVMSRTDAHRYVASLTDAGGQVRAEAYGDLFHLTYPLKGAPLGGMEQWLYLQPDGCTVVNEAVVRVAGLTVRRLSERISRRDGACAAKAG